jgi:hypothetical protein
MPKNAFPEREHTTLKDRITNAAKWAKQSPGQEVHIALARGLHIWISYETTASGTGDYFLKIGRQRVAPSTSEWRAVLNAWMWPLNKHQEVHENNGWYYRSALIEDRTETQSKLFDPPLM